MRNQNTIRTFPHSRSQSKLHIVNDGKSVAMSEQQMQYDERTELSQDENIHIYNWLRCKSKVYKRYISQSVLDSTASNNCYMIQIDEILDISYKKKIVSVWQKDKDKLSSLKSNLRKDAEDSKVYVKVIANFYGEDVLEYSARTVEFGIIELEQKSSSSYKVSFPNIAIFLHTKFTSESKYKVRMQLSVIQSRTVDNFEVVESQEYLGFCDIDPFKGIKAKQKGFLTTRKVGTNLETCILYTVIVSDSFKVIERVIPPNCLCSSEQGIPGVIGRKLPNNISNLYSQIQYTQLHSMRIDVLGVDIPEVFFNLKLRQIEEQAKAFEYGVSAIASIKDIKLNVMFHNGWTVFSESQVNLELKIDITTKNIKKQSDNMKIKHYSPESVCFLPFMFFDQECLFIMQVMVKIQIRKKTEKTDVTTFMVVPLCYCFYANDKMINDDKQMRVMVIGDGLNDVGRRNDSKLQGKIQFYVSIEQANKLQLSRHLVSGSVLVNKSQTEADKMMIAKERMMRENKKLKHQNRIKKIQLNQEIPLLDTTSYKQNLYKDQIQKLRQQRKQKEELLEYLKKKVNEVDPKFKEKSVGKKSVGKRNQNEEKNRDFTKKFDDPTLTKNFHDSVFYQAVLEKEEKIPIKNKRLSSNVENFKVHPFSLMRNTSNIYLSGEIPIETMKTELLEKNYSYAIFINCISFIPVTEWQKLPRKFIFQTNFFNKTQLKSCICCVNESTGEIVVDETSQQHPKNESSKSGLKQNQNEKKERKSSQKSAEQQNQKNDKIFYIEIGADQQIVNNDNNFLQLISYLYHSELQIKIIDVVSKIEFGQCYFPLKELIRIRRNQCTVIRDVWVGRNGYVKAKLKAEIKSLRKLGGNSGGQILNEIEKHETLLVQPEARQLQRIAHFKKSKLENGSATISKVEKMLNEQLTKEQMKLKVSRMRGQFIKLRILNRNSYTQLYTITINDPDRRYLSNEELVVVNQVMLKTLKNMGWWKYLYQLNVIQSNDLIATDERNNFKLKSGQVGTLLLRYYSNRKYEGDCIKQITSKLEMENNSDQVANKKNSQVLKVYNHSRCIDLSMRDSSSDALHSIYKINIVSEPESSTFIYEIVRKSNSKLVIEIPFRSGEKYGIYLDDATAMFRINERENYVIVDCFVGDEGSEKKVNVSILSPFPENRLIVNYRFVLRGAKEIQVEGKLWETQEILVDFHSSICLKKGLQLALALSEDENTVGVREKNPVKVNQKQAKTVIRMNVTPASLGLNYYELNIINPIDNSVIYRYSLKVRTSQPEIQETIPLKVRVNDKMMEYSFTFQNDVARKLKLRVLSTHPHIVWSTQETVEVEGRSEKVFKLKINGEEICSNLSVIVTLVGGKKIFHYLFVFELDNQF